MANWARNDKNTTEIDCFTPKDLTNSRDFTKDLHMRGETRSLELCCKNLYIELK